MKKPKAIILTILFLAPVFSFAQVATTSISLPPNFTTDIISQASLLFANFSPYITLVLSILFILLIIGILISYFR
jgi:hypothetical protein